MQVRTKPTVHVTLPPQVLAMADQMAAEDALPGVKPDRSDLIARAVVALWKSRTAGIVATARKPKRAK